MLVNTALTAIIRQFPSRLKMSHVVVCILARWRAGNEGWFAKMFEGDAFLEMLLGGNDPDRSASEKVA